MISLVSDLTGQKLILDTLLSYMSPPHRLLVYGEPGSGKKTLSKHAAERWDKLDGAKVLTLTNISRKAELEYSPFYSAIDSFHGEKKRALDNILREAGRDVPFIGNTLSALIDFVLQKHKSHAYNAFPLSEEEQVICKLMEKKLRGKTKVLLICENIDVWGPEAQNLLGAIMNGQVEMDGVNTFSFLITSDSTPLPSHIVASCSAHFLQPIPRNSVKDVLRAFNSTLYCSPEQEDMLFTVSGGNLQILKECSHLFGSSPMQAIAQGSFWLMLTERINHEVKNSQDLVELLKRLSVIGYNSQKELLRRFSQDCIEDYGNTIGSGINLKLIEETSNAYEFSNRVIRELAYESISARRAQYHKQLEQCIYILYPSAYKERSNHLLLSGDKRNAAVLYLIFLLFHLRTTGCEIQLFDNAYLVLMKEFGLDVLYNKIKKAYFLYFKNEYQSSREILDNIYAEDLEIRFEVDYLRGLIISNWTCAGDIFTEKLDMLYYWHTDKFKEKHLEMWLRVTMLLAEFLYEIGKADEGKILIHPIMQVFDEKAPTDIRIRNQLHVFHLKANQFYSVEMAFARVEQALQYFTPSDGTNTYLRNYYLALVNQAANLTIMGRAIDGFARAEEAKQLLLSFPDISFSKQEVLINNYVLSGYLSGKLNCDDALAELAPYQGKLGNYADELLINNSIAAFWALQGDIDEAIRISESLYAYITSREDNDPYYSYFLMNNYAVINCIAKSFSPALDILEKATNIIPLPRNRQYFLHRNRLIKELIKKNFFNELPNNWNTHLITSSPYTVGPCWAFWGRLLLFSDLQVWTDV